MAQYTVAAGCGHTTTVDLVGAGKERDRRIAWMESAAGACNACYAARKRAEERDAAEERVAALVSELTDSYGQLTEAARPAAVEAMRASYRAGAGNADQRTATERVYAALGLSL